MSAKMVSKTVFAIHPCIPVPSIRKYGKFPKLKIIVAVGTGQETNELQNINKKSQPQENKLSELYQNCKEKLQNEIKQTEFQTKIKLFGMVVLIEIKVRLSGTFWEVLQNKKDSSYKRL